MTLCLVLPISLLAAVSAAGLTGACSPEQAGCRTDSEVSSLLQRPAKDRTLQMLGMAGTVDPWSQDGSIFGVQPWDVYPKLSESVVTQAYGPAAMERGQAWVKEGKSLWCGDQQDPDGVLPPGSFPFAVPTTNFTFWVNSCPKSKEAQGIFNKALTYRFLFNDNEAACAFQAAADVDKTCALAPLAKAYSMGPNVNYAELAGPAVYNDILNSMVEGSNRMRKYPDDQSEYAQAFYDALLQFYCVADKGALLRMQTLANENASAAYDKYMANMTNCTHQWAVAMSGIAQTFPGDPNLNGIATGALMQDPAWKWWKSGGMNGSLLAGSLANVSIADQKHNLKEQSIKKVSELVEPMAAQANTMIWRSLGVSPKHLGGLHFAIHNMEAGPVPVWAEGVADALYSQSQFQGHAIHMQTHIATRIGDWKVSTDYNLESVYADSMWNINRTGGGIQSLLYKYVPHNSAFAAEASQHGFMFKDLAGSLSFLNYCSGFGYESNSNMGSLLNFLQQQFTRPTRFGNYAALVQGTGKGGAAPMTIESNTTLRIYLPKKTYVMDTGEPNQIYGSVLWARVWSLARLNQGQEANAALTEMIGLPFYNEKPCDDAHRKEGTFAKVDYLAKCWKQEFEDSKDATVDSSSTMASGTLTINNGPLVLALNLLTAGAEAARSSKPDDVYSYLVKAYNWQKELQYDEPAPFFYPTGETLAGYLLQRYDAPDPCAKSPNGAYGVFEDLCCENLHGPGCNGQLPVGCAAGGLPQVCRYCFLPGSTLNDGSLPVCSPDEPDDKKKDLDEAEIALRTVLFQWPRSALASFALSQVLERKGQTTAAAYALDSATMYNDTELKLEYL